MTTRSRYDTTALIEKLRLERRRNLILGMCAGGTLALLVVIYLFNMRGMTIPEVPADPTPRTPTGAAAAPAVTTAPFATVGGAAVPPNATPGAAETQPATPAPAPAPTPDPEKAAGLKTTFPNSALAWLDDVALSRTGTAHKITPGSHLVRLKIGKQSVSQRFIVAPGELVELRLDKKKKVVVAKHALGKTQLE